MNVLIADDDRTNRTILADMVVSLGHTVTTVTNGVEAIEATTCDSAPDFVLLDFLMPRMSGFDALKAMRRQGVTLPVVMFSAISETSLAKFHGAHEADGFLEKPFQREAVKGVIEAVMTRHAARCTP